MNFKMIKKLLHYMSLYYYAHMTEKKPNTSYLGTNFKDRLSKSLLARWAGSMFMFILFFAILNGYTVPLNTLGYVVVWFMIDIFGGLLGSVIINQNVRTKYAKGCYMPLILVNLICLLEKYDNSKVVK